MEFSRRNVNKSSRNGDIIITRGDGTLGTTSSGSGGGGGISGNYLPATPTENGLYIVDLANVKFSGNIYAAGEISAYGQGGGGTTSSGNTEILDTLTSSSVTAALSANQGRVLNEKIQNTYTKAQVDALVSSNGGTGTTVDLSNYYTKEQTYSKTEVDEKISGHTGNYLPANKNDDGSYTVDLEKVTFNGRIVATSEISAYGEGETPEGIVVDLSNYYTKDEVYNKSETYTKNQIEALFDTYEANVDLTNYYTKTQTDTKLSSKSNTGHTHDYLPLTGGTMSNQNLVTNLNADLLDGYSGSAYLKKSESGHTHPISAITNLQSSLDGKSGTGHSHSNYSLTSHTHSNYSTTGHTHDDRYYTETEVTNKLAGYSPTSHTHSNYSVTSHTHDDRYFTETEINTKLAGKSDTSHTHSNYSVTSHTHDGRYYTESEVDTKLSNKYDKTGGTVSGSITATGNIVANGEVTSLSDARLKKNITPLQSRGKLNPVTYTKDGKQCIGFVAQDVNELYPELVLETFTNEKYLSVNYPQITAVLAAQINELYSIIDKLRKELKNK